MILTIEPRELKRHYADVRSRLMARAEPPVKITSPDGEPLKRKIAIEPLKRKIEKLERENNLLRNFLRANGVNPEDIASPSARLLPPLNKILSAVCRFYKVSEIDMRSARQSRQISLPRGVFCYLAKQETLFSYPAIGRAIGNRDHTTIMTATRKITKLLETDEGIQNDVRIIRARLGLV